MNKKFLSVFFIAAMFITACFISVEAAPQVSTTIVISQAYGGGGGASGTYLYDYVELKNISSTPQSLDGLSLMYGSSTGQFGSSSSNVFALPTGVVLQPGQYYLIQLSSAGSAGTELPVTPDAVTTNLGMSGTNGKVALTNGLTPNSCGATATPCTLPNAQIIDLVAWGTANNAEGGAATNGGASLTAVQGNVRKSNGCQDTDNNNNDFTIVENPVPRNRSTAAAPCGGTVPAKATLFDFTGNGRTDWTVLGPIAAGQPIRWKITANPSLPGPNQAFIRAFDYGIGGDSIVPNNYRGDKKVEVAVRRADTFYVAQFPTGSGGITLDAAVPFGRSTDTAGADGDYDNDGLIDYTVVRVSNNVITYYMLLSSTNTFRAITFGLLDASRTTSLMNGADFTGDGRDEIVLFTYDASGQITYYIGNAVDGTLVSVLQWGNYNTDYSVTPADYTGDGKADLVAIRETTSPATWFIRNTATGAMTAVPFGVSDPTFTNEDSPVRGDYDGDGVHDIAVWRPSNQTFYVRKSSDGMLLGQKWGDTAADVPLANLLGVY